MDDQPEMKTKNPWHRPLFIGIIVLCALGFIAMVIVGVVQNKAIHQKYKYGIVLDAGSSHSSVYIYHWPAEKENNTGMVQQTHACDVKGKGISSYSMEPHKAGESLKECMEEAKKQIPVHRHSETPVYLGATAGMRLLKMENDVASEKVLRSVEKSLQSYPFSYQGARIITGQEEGAFGWITVNYLSQNFGKASGTIGALDLGGASTQITFVTKQNVESQDNSIDFRLYGNDYHVYTHSFLCYGKDQALRLNLAHQIRSKLEMPDIITLEDPCFHHGYNVTKSFQDVFNTPCVEGLNVSRTFRHVGTGNGEECRAAVRKVFNTSICAYSGCSFNGVFQPQVEGRFGAFSAFYFVMSFLNLNSEGNLDKAKEGVEKHCATSWKKISEANPNVKEKYLSEYCFSGTYILTLLEDGYNVTSENYKNIKFIKKIGDSDAGWTLGYMLNLTNMIPAEAPDTPPLPHGSYVTIMIFIALIIFVLGGIAYKIFRRPTATVQKEII